MEIFAAIDIETTGLDVEQCEILDIAVIPLTTDFTIDTAIPEFTARIRAEHPDTAEAQAMQVNGLNPAEGKSRKEVAGELSRWLADCEIERLVPVAHNLEFDIKFIRRCFPVESKVFSHCGRDSMYLARAVNDIFRRETGEELFPGTSLRVVRDVLGIAGEQTHHALDDARDTAIAYRKMLERLTRN